MFPTTLLLAALAATPTVSLTTPGSAETLRAVAVDEDALLTGVRLEDAALSLELERFEVNGPATTIVVHSGEVVRLLPPSPTLYFSGTSRDRPDILAVLMLRESGQLDGFIASDDGRHELRGSRFVRAEEALASAATGCDNDAWPMLPPDVDATARRNSDPSLAAAELEVDLAIETDFELFQVLGSDAAARDYATDLVAGATAVYRRDIDISFRISHISLWSTSADPWVQSAGGTFCGLAEFGTYWEGNRAGIQRDVAHFLSGKPLGGGVAWLGVLCAGGFDTDASSCGIPAAKGGGYAFSANIAGNYDPNGPNLPPSTDFNRFVHELGHNFSSPHTHCYGDGFAVPDVDHCHNGEANRGCYGGATSLPADGGSIMSYCYRLPGGFANMNMVLGRAGSFGTSSERVPQRMRAHAEGAGCITARGACLFDPHEPNDEVGSATALSGADYSSFIAGTCIAAAGDRDWFRVSCSAGQLINASVVAEELGSPLDPKLSLFDPGGAEVASNSSVGTGLRDARLGFVAQQTGAHGVKVEGLAGTSGTYRVRAYCRDLRAAQSFDDVPAGHIFAAAIQSFSGAGITDGCSVTPRLFCPDDAVTRGQMAVFILRALGLAPNAGGAPRFTDVPASHQFFGFIQVFADLGITQGCGAGLFCPAAPVTRGQMAVFLIRALDNKSRPDLGPTFGDVPAGHVFHGFVESFAAQGITGGCGAGNYCPDAPVTRGQMAIFMTRAFGLPAPPPGIDGGGLVAEGAGVVGLEVDDVRRGPGELTRWSGRTRRASTP